MKNNNYKALEAILANTGAKFVIPTWPKVVIPHSVFGDISFDVADVNPETNEITLLMSDCIVPGFEFDAAEIEGSDGGNHRWRTQFGNNNYGQSAIRQWLNADTDFWWKPQHKYDIAPSYADKPGFLAGFSKEFVDRLVRTKRICATNVIFETGEVDGVPIETDSQYIVEDRMFLPSITELTGDANNGVMEGKQFSEPINLVKSDWYWMRSCSPWSARDVRGVNDDGDPGYVASACDRLRGFAAACVIKGI